MKKYTIVGILCVLLGIYSCSEDTIDVVGDGTITGTVIDKVSGEPLQNAKISTTPASSTVFTDAQGDFTIPNVPVDNYAVQAELENYTTGFESAIVTDGNTVNVAFELQVSSSNNRPPTAPILLSPEDESTENPLEVVFLWTASDPNGDELEYTLELRNGSSNEIQRFENLTDTTLTVGSLQLATRYFWQVSASDDVNAPVSSTVSEFTTLSSPDNPYLLVKKINGNNVIFSGNEDPDNDPDDDVDVNLLQLTSENFNSFRPRRNTTVEKVAFMRTVGGNTQLFTMNLDGTALDQVTSNIPIAGFRNDEIDFCWAANGSKIYYPNFDKLYEINPDGGGATLIYQTPDGSLISEVESPEFDSDLVLLKTNNFNGYDVRIYTVRLSTQEEQYVVLEDTPGAAGSIDITANGNRVLFNRDVSGSQNNQYRLFDSRLFLYIVDEEVISEIMTDRVAGENEFDASFSPSEGGVIFVRALSNVTSQKNIFTYVFGQNTDDDLLFTDAFMPDWE